MRKFTTIGAAYVGRENRLTPIRWVLASAVMVEHAVVVTIGPILPSPVAVNGWSIGYAAVNAFFVLSGFLIADSLERRADPFVYAAARALRILPALVFLSLGAVLVVGPVASDLTLSAYWSSAQTWLYPVNVLAFMDTSQGPAGIFTDNPWPGEFSATLWTLRYEVLAYVAAGVLFFFRLFWGWRSHLFLFVAATLAYLALRYGWTDAPPMLMSGARLASAFSLGMFVHASRHRLPLAPIIAVLATPAWLLLGSQPVAEVAMNLAIASTLFWIGFARLGGAPTGARIPDWSYGIYIWHYPMMQLVVFFDRSATPLEVAVFTVPATLAISGLSWSYVEKPSLGLKTVTGERLRSTWLALFSKRAERRTRLR